MLKYIFNNDVINRTSTYKNGVEVNFEKEEPIMTDP